MTFLDKSEIEAMGFSSVGENALISNRASFYNCAQISIGSNVRVDDFCIISAGKNGIIIGNHVHIAAYTSLIGAGRISISDFCNISSRVSIYSSSDDYSGCSLTNPTIPNNFKNVHHADVNLEKHVIVGCGSVILPGLDIKEGAAIGALSLVNDNCSAFSIYAGVPAKFIKSRNQKIKELEILFHAQAKLKNN